MFGKKMSGRKAKRYLVSGQYYADLEGHYLQGVQKGIETTEARLLPHVEELADEVQFVVDYMDGRGNILDEHCFTFPDGHTVYATGHDPHPE